MALITVVLFLLAKSVPCFKAENRGTNLVYNQPSTTTVIYEIIQNRLLGVVSFEENLLAVPLPLDKAYNCPRGSHYETESGCVQEKEQNPDVTEYNLQLLVHNSTLAGNNHLRHFAEWKHLAKSFKPFVKELAKAGSASRFSYSVGLFKEFPQWWKKWNSTSVPIYFSANMQVNLNVTSHNNFSRNVLSVLADGLQISVDGLLMNMDFELFNGSYETENEIIFVPELHSGDCCVPFTRKEGRYAEVQNVSEELVFYEMSCESKTLDEEGDYELIDGGIILLFEGLGQKSNIVKEPYSFHGDDIITICRNIYERYYTVTWAAIQKIKHPFGKIKWAVTVVCLSLSLFCLLLTFLTYCMFPSLRTIPAKNNIGLIVCLFMTQMVYVNGFLKSDEKLLCQILGASLHYFWLSAIFWMNICCFHVFKGFVLTKTITTPKGSCMILSRYILYANGLPVIIVCAVITTNLILSEGQKSGYGGIFCFLSTALLNGLTVVLPLCLVLISNFVFFTVTICTINKTKQVRRNTGGDRQNLWIYIKLSSITGLFWMFAIVEAALKIEALAYISIILNGSQGVFLFISYCCNKRILRFWKTKLTGKKEGVSQTTESSKSLRTQGTETTDVNAQTNN